MLDFPNLITKEMDVQLFTGGTYNNKGTINQWYDFQTWHKPSMARMIYMIGVGGGGSGGWSVNTASTAGGGAGGSSGSTVVGFMPAHFFPDILYIGVGLGGLANAAAAVSMAGLAGANGQATIVTTTPGVYNQTAFGSYSILCSPNGGPGGGGANTTSGGAGIGNPASQGGVFWDKGIGRIYGQNSTGGAGGAPGANGAAGESVAGIYTACGGGGSTNGSVVGTGGGFVQPLVSGIGPDFYSNTIGGAPAIGSTPAGKGQDGYTLVNFMQQWGGSGGGGDSGVSGGVAGNGGAGCAFGCGGGGAGGSTNANVLAIPGSGSDGAVMIVCW